MKDHQLNLSALSKDLDKNKYLDALAAPYNLNVSKTRKKEGFHIGESLYFFTFHSITNFNGCGIEPLNLVVLYNLNPSYFS